MKKNFLRLVMARLFVVSAVLTLAVSALAHNVQLTFVNTGSVNVQVNYSYGYPGTPSGSGQGSVQTLAPNQSYTFSANSCDNCGYAWNSICSVGPTLVQSSADNNGSGQTFYWTFYVGTGSAPPCTTNLVFKFKNNSGQLVTYAVIAKGSLQQGVTETGFSPTDVQPGGTGQISFSTACTNSSLFSLCVLGAADRSVTVFDPAANQITWTPGAGSMEFTNQPSGVNIMTNTVDQFNSGSSYNASNTTNSPILWSASAGTNSAVAIQQGSAAMVNALVNGIAEAHGDAVAVVAAINAAKNQAHTDTGIGTGSINNLTNWLAAVAAASGNAGAIGTNYAFDVSAENSLGGISNLLSNIGNTNADIATETTQQAVTNLLNQANSTNSFIYQSLGTLAQILASNNLSPSVLSNLVANQSLFTNGNLFEQQIASNSVFIRSNSDVLPTYISNFLGSSSGSITNSINSESGQITNAIGQAENGLLNGLGNSFSNGLGGLGSAMSNAIAKLGSNSVPGSGLSLSNYNLETTQVQVSNILNGISNLLSSAITNGDGGDKMLSLIPWTATNAGAAESAAAAAQGDYGVDNLIGSLTPSLPSSSPAEPDMTVSMFGETLDLNPVHMFPSASALCLAGFRVMLLLAFLIEVGRLFWDLLKIRASTQTGGVPDLDVSGGLSFLGIGGNVGGNFIGVMIAIIIPSVFLALFSAAMAYLFSNMGISIADAMHVTDFTEHMSGVAYYLLASFFPVNLFFSLVCTRITLTFTLGKIVALATAAARYLFGK